MRYNPINQAQITQINQTKIFLLDLDGTLYIDESPIKGAIQAVSLIKEKGKKVCFLTNNSSRSRERYLDKLKRMGFDADIEEIVTSGTVTENYLQKARKNKKVYLLGTLDLKSEFERAGINLVSDYPDIVIIGYHTSVTYNEINDTCRFIRNGAEFWATHPDKNCPSKDGFMPDTGSFLKLIECSTGRKPSKIIGKPYRYMIWDIRERYNILPKFMAMVGDRLTTDIMFGIKNKLLNVLVLSGETNDEMLQNFRQKPDIVLPTIFDLANLLI